MPDAPDGLLKALHAVQANAPTLKKDATGQIQSRSYKYVTLDSIVEALKDLLRTNNLVWTTMPTGTHEAPMLRYQLLHVPTNERIENVMPIMVGEHPTSQALGSAITYARRYALTAVLNLVADEDDDAAAAQSHGRTSRRAKEYNAAADNGREATKPQKGKVRGEATKAGLKSMDDWAAFSQRMLGKPVPINNLTFDQADFLIDRLLQGAVPEGTSDVPSDTEPFEQPSLEGGDPVPWEGEKP